MRAYEHFNNIIYSQGNSQDDWVSLVNETKSDQNE